MSVSTADAVRIVFQAVGLEAVNSAFESIESRMMRFEKVSARSAQTRVANENAAARVVGSAAAKAASDQTRAEARVSRELAQAAKQRDRIRENSAGMAGRLAAKLANEEIRETERAAKAKLAADEKWAKQRARILEWSASHAGKLAAKEAAEEERAAKGRQRHVRQHVAGAVQGVVGRAATVVGGVAALGGGVGVIDSLSSEFRAEKQATALSNATYIPGEQERVDSKTLLGQAKAVQAETNIDKSTALEAAGKYIDLTSDTSIFNKKKDGRTNFQEMAKIAKATGSDINDVFEAAGSLRAQNDNLTSDAMLNMLYSTVGQTKKGAVSFKDAAHETVKITSTSSAYSGSQEEAQKTLLGLAQVGRKAAPTEEQGTSVSRFTEDVLEHQKKLKETYGISVADKHGKLRDANEVMADMIGKSGGDLQALHEMGLGKESLKLAMGALSFGSDHDSVLKGLNNVRNATYSKDDIDKDFAAVMADRSEKMAAVLEKLQEEIATAVIPVFDKLAARLPDILPKFEAIIEGGGKLAEWLMDNPLKGVGAAVALSVTKDIAAAQLEKAITSLIVTPFGQVALAAAGLAAAGKVAIDILSDKQVKGQSAPDEEARKVDNVRRKLDAGQPLTDDDKSELDRAKNLKEHLDGIDLDPDKAKTLADRAAFMARILEHPMDAVEKMGAMQTGGMGRLTEALQAFATAADKLVKAPPKPAPPPPLLSVADPHHPARTQPLGAIPRASL